MPEMPVLSGGGSSGGVELIGVRGWVAGRRGKVSAIVVPEAIALNYLRNDVGDSFRVVAILTDAPVATCHGEREAPEEAACCLACKKPGGEGGLWAAVDGGRVPAPHSPRRVAPD